MADNFLGEIRAFGFNFAPVGWAFCNGQLLSISQASALFSLLGTFYGGNGTSNFALPNLQGNLPVCPGQGPGLSTYVIGETDGSANVSLLQNQLPIHTHTLMAAAPPASAKTPTIASVLARSSGGIAYLAPDAGLGPMSPSMVAPTGSGVAHNNLMPYLALNFCIALTGIFPPRS